jgi:hypothetical protein
MEERVKWDKLYRSLFEDGMKLSSGKLLTFV